MSFIASLFYSNPVTTALVAASAVALYTLANKRIDRLYHEQHHADTGEQQQQQYVDEHGVPVVPFVFMSHEEYQRMVEEEEERNRALEEEREREQMKAMPSYRMKMTDRPYLPNVSGGTPLGLSDPSQISVSDKIAQPLNFSQTHSAAALPPPSTVPSSLITSTRLKQRPVFVAKQTTTRPSRDGQPPLSSDPIMAATETVQQQHKSGGHNKADELRKKEHLKNLRKAQEARRIEAEKLLRETKRKGETRAPEPVIDDGTAPSGRVVEVSADASADADSGDSRMPSDLLQDLQQRKQSSRDARESEENDRV